MKQKFSKPQFTKRPLGLAEKAPDTTNTVMATAWFTKQL